MLPPPCGVTVGQFSGLGIMASFGVLGRQGFGVFAVSKASAQQLKIGVVEFGLLELQTQKSFAVFEEVDVYTPTFLVFTMASMQIAITWDACAQRLVLSRDGQPVFEMLAPEKIHVICLLKLDNSTDALVRKLPFRFILRWMLQEVTNPLIEVVKRLIALEANASYSIICLRSEEIARCFSLA